ncbi:MAG: helix-turn-helix transcriptional regulator [Oxalobacter sp.]|nr:helix-turn-helix transcriptional regulator [Oxalobacter sp.]
MTQERLAELVDLQTLSISRIERGSVAPSLATISKIANALDVPVSTLFLMSPSSTAIAYNLVDVLESLPEEYRSFVYGQFREWCSVLTQALLSSGKVDAEKMPPLRHTRPTNADAIACQSSPVQPKDKMKKSK